MADSDQQRFVSIKNTLAKAIKLGIHNKRTTEDSDHQQQIIVSSFLDIVVGESDYTARQFLEATNWKLDEAIQLYFVRHEDGINIPTSVQSPPRENNDGDYVRAPLPVKRDLLYGRLMKYEDEIKQPAVWDTNPGSSSSSSAGEHKSEDNLASLYRSPVALMFRGSFEKAKVNAREQNKWLLVNMQSTGEFNSHLLNRDTWANETVFQTIETNFVFWQVNDDTEEGSKVCNYYKIQDLPAVILVDPLTGQKMRSLRGMVQPETLLEDLLSFLDDSPSDHHASFSRKRPRESSQSTITRGIETNKTKDADLERKVKKPKYLPLPEEPKGDRNMLCRVVIRFPDGRRSQRNFFRKDPIQLLWSFCSSEMKEDGEKLFRLTHAIPGASKSLDFDQKSTFEDSDLANSMISVTWNES